MFVSAHDEGVVIDKPCSSKNALADPSKDTADGEKASSTSRYGGDWDSCRRGDAGRGEGDFQRQGRSRRRQSLHCGRISSHFFFLASYQYDFQIKELSVEDTVLTASYRIYNPHAISTPEVGVILALLHLGLASQALAAHRYGPDLGE
jgi:hypothetical protein